MDVLDAEGLSVSTEGISRSVFLLGLFRVVHTTWFCLVHHLVSSREPYCTTWFE